MTSAERAEWAAYFLVLDDEHKNADRRRDLAERARTGLDDMKKRR